jgi:hypothetical protein
MQAVFEAVELTARDIGYPTCDAGGNNAVKKRLNSALLCWQGKMHFCASHSRISRKQKSRIELEERSPLNFGVSQCAGNGKPPAVTVDQIQHSTDE